MPPHPTTLLLALLFAAANATAATHRTLNLLRGSEVARVAEAGIGGVWVVNITGGVQYFSDQ